MAIDPNAILEFRRQVASNEDWRTDRYYDNAIPPNPTVGVGFNLNRRDARERIEALGVDYGQLVAGNVRLTDAQVDRLFTQDIQTAVTDVRALVPGFDNLPLSRQTVLVDMAFNMGGGARGLAGFHRMLAAVNAGDWQTAANEIANTPYYAQVGPRAARNVAAMATGLPPVRGNPPHPKPIDSKTGKEVKETKEGKEGKEGKEHKEGKESKEIKELKEGKEGKEEKEGKEDKESKEDKEAKEEKEEKEGKEGKEEKEGKEGKEGKEEKEGKEGKEGKEEKEGKEDKEIKELE